MANPGKRPLSAHFGQFGRLYTHHQRKTASALAAKSSPMPQSLTATNLYFSTGNIISRATFFPHFLTKTCTAGRRRVYPKKNLRTIQTYQKIIIFM